LTFFLQAIFIILGFIASIWLNEIFKVLIKGHVVTDLVPIGIIILMSYSYRPMYLAASVHLMFFEKTNSLWKISFGAGVINALLNLALIPILGFKIAAITTFVSYLYMGLSGFFTKEFKEISKENYYPLFWGGIIILTTIISYGLWSINFIYKILLTVILLAIIVIPLKNKINRINDF